MKKDDLLIPPSYQYSEVMNKNRNNRNFKTFRLKSLLRNSCVMRILTCVVCLRHEDEVVHVGLGATRGLQGGEVYIVDTLYTTNIHTL